METIGGILAGLTLLTLLAAVGLTTLVAFALMTGLGLLTNMTFKRLFFMSFIMALAAPLLVGIGVYAVLQDGSLERDLRDDLAGVISIGDEVPENWAQAVPRLRDLRDQFDNGTIDEAEFERRVEKVIEETTQIRIDVEGVGAAAAGEAGNSLTFTAD
jgi:hypothetical protein